LTYGRLYTGLWSRLERARGAVGALLHEALSDEERAQIVARLFARRDGYGPSGLAPWEERWYERDLPPAPARVLIGGCGSGREHSALAARGYTVLGFEPSPRLADAARRALPGVQVWTLSYEQLIDDEHSPIDQHAPYDAAILGWGSFAHVLDATARARVLEALERLAPHGPLLLSFPFLSGTVDDLGRRCDLAERLGRRIRRWRGLADAVTEPEEFLPHAGFVHRFSERELTALATGLGRSLRWGERSDVYPHCSFSACDEVTGRPSPRADTGPSHR
jgi:SAM-dependent methyltransferase